MNNSPSPALAKLAEALRRHRKLAGLTQADLAKRIPCSDKTVSAIETGRDRPEGAFVIGTMGSNEEVAYIETAVRGIVTSSREDIIQLNDSWERVRSHAMSQRESLDFIRRTAEERWT
jgi:DNA-binding XRE family transcriptional regulator